MSHGNESLVIEPRNRLPCHRVSWQASTKHDECQDDDGCVISTNYQWRFRDRLLATKRQRTGNKPPLEAFNQFEISGAKTISSFITIMKSRESGNSISSSTNNHSSSFLEFDYLLSEYSSREEQKISRSRSLIKILKSIFIFTIAKYLFNDKTDEKNCKWRENAI